MTIPHSRTQSRKTAPHPINIKQATDRMFCFLTMIELGHTDRTTLEREVERYADGADAVISDGQREKRKEREWLRWRKL